jgi:hypothetical protein
MARESGLETQDGFSESVFYFAKLVAKKAFEDGYSIGEAAGFKEGVKLERKARGQQ